MCIVKYNYLYKFSIAYLVVRSSLIWLSHSVSSMPSEWFVPLDCGELNVALQLFWPYNKKSSSSNSSKLGVFTAGSFSGLI